MNLRPAFAIAVLAAVGLAPLATPEHVHAIADGDGHHATLTHRHAELHLGHGRASDHDRATVEDDETVAATLDLVSTLPGVRFVQALSFPTVLFLQDEPARPALASRADLIEPLIHAPPRGPTVLRGPPPTLTL